MRAKSLAAFLAIVLMVGLAFGYTEGWQPVYYDRTLIGGASSTVVLNQGDLLNVPINYDIIMDTLHMATGTQCDTIATTSTRGIYNPTLFSLNGTVTVGIGIPNGVNSSTYIPYFAPGDSYAIVLPGRWNSFILYKTGSVDSTAATGYVVVGHAGPALDYMRLK